MTAEEGRAWRDSRYKIPEGYRMTVWPRFRALMTRLGVPVPDIKDPGTRAAAVREGRQPEYETAIQAYREKVCVEYLGPHETVKVTINGTITDTGYDSFEAFRFPESAAYFDILGIPWHMFVIALKIEFAVGEFPSYTMRAALAVPESVPDGEYGEYGI